MRLRGDHDIQLSAIALGLASALILTVPQRGLADAMDNQLARASLLIEAEHLMEARRILEPICRSKYASPTSLCLLADTYLDWIDTDDESPGAKEAELGLVRAIYMEPEWGRAYKNLAEFANLREDYSQAVFLSTKAMTAKYPDYYSLKQRSIAYSHLNKQNEALADINTFIKLEPDGQISYMMKAGILQTLKRFDEAAAACRVGLTKRGINNQALTQRLLSNLVYAQKFDAAIAVATQVINNNRVPQSVDFFIRAKVECDAKRYPQSIEDLNKAISIDRVSKYFKQRAEIYTLLGRKDLAAKDLLDAEHDNF